MHFSIPFFLPSSWDADMIDGAWAAILDREGIRQQDRKKAGFLMVMELPYQPWKGHLRTVSV